MTDFERTREDLLRTDDEFRDWMEQHRALDSRLAELSGFLHLTEPEQQEEATLKKRKLHLKDLMETRVREHLTRPAAVEAAGALPAQPRG